jgi:hypothetical protein
MITPRTQAALVGCMRGKWIANLTAFVHTC